MLVPSDVASKIFAWNFLFLIINIRMILFFPNLYPFCGIDNFSCGP